MSTVNDAFLVAQSLGTDEKLQLISRIWDSIPSNSFRPSDSDLEIVKKRWAEYESGKVEAISWEEVWTGVERQLDAND